MTPEYNNPEGTIGYRRGWEEFFRLERLNILWIGEVFYPCPAAKTDLLRLSGAGAGL